VLDVLVSAPVVVVVEVSAVVLVEAASVVVLEAASVVLLDPEVEASAVVAAVVVVGSSVPVVAVPVEVSPSTGFFSPQAAVVRARVSSAMVMVEVRMVKILRVDV